VSFGERIRSSSERHDSRIILALDLTGDPLTRADRAASTIGLLGDHIAAVKLNFHVLLPAGLQGIVKVASACTAKSLPLIADIKLNDIESTNLEAARFLFENGFDAIIANPFVGAKEGLSAVIAKAHESGRGIILLVYMSHAGAAEGYGLDVGGEPLYLKFAERAREWGADGAIVSSKSLDVIRQVRRTLDPEQLIISPGIGVQGGDGRKALEAGMDYAIVGRSIIEATDPAAALTEFNHSVRKT
jgi:orotidine-5'-phosphate decarboxylase